MLRPGNKKGPRALESQSGFLGAYLEKRAAHLYLVCAADKLKIPKESLSASATSTTLQVHFPDKELLAPGGRCGFGKKGAAEACLRVEPFAPV